MSSVYCMMCTVCARGIKEGIDSKCAEMTPGKGKAGPQGWVGFEGQREGIADQPPRNHGKRPQQHREGRDWHCCLFFICTYLSLPEGIETMSVVMYCTRLLFGI